MKKRVRNYFFILAIISLLPLFGSMILFFLVSHYSSFLENLSFFGLSLFYLLMIFTMAGALTPTTFVAFISGYFFSWWGFPMMIVAYLAASAIGIFLGKLFSKDVLAGITGENKKWDLFVSKMEHRLFPMVFYARLSPVMPFAMVNIALSSLRISLPTYFAGTLLGMLPRTFLFFWIGKNASGIMQFFKHPTGEGAWKLFPFLLIFISLSGLIYYAKKSWNEASEGADKTTGKS